MSQLDERDDDDGVCPGCGGADGACDCFDGHCECGGDGWIVTCCDDLCRGAGYCIHGDGMEMCACNTSCEPPSNATREWRWTPAEDDPADCGSPSHPGCKKCEEPAV